MRITNIAFKIWVDPLCPQNLQLYTDSTHAKGEPLNNFIDSLQTIRKGKSSRQWA